MPDQTDKPKTADWRPIGTAPKDRVVPLLLWFPWGDTDNPAYGGAHGTMMIGLWGYPLGEDNGPSPCWVDESDGERLGDASHWMPLPKPPK